MPANVVLQEVDNSGSAYINTGAAYQRTLELPEDLDNALLYVHFGFDSFNFAQIANVPNIPVTFDGVPMNATVKATNSVEVRQGSGCAWLPIGDGSAFPGRLLKINMAGVIPAHPNVMRVHVQIFVINGITQTDGLLDQNEVTNFDAAPGATILLPVNDGFTGSFVITSCMTGTQNTPQIVAAPATFVSADAMLNLGFFGKGQTAWALTADGEQDVTWNLVGTDDIPFGNHSLAYAFAIEPPPEVPCDESHNCECDTAEGARPLGELRLEMLRETGYAAQAHRPPPGIVEMYNGFLDRSQKYIYQRYRSMQTERFFSWVLQSDVRYYGVKDSDSCCDARLDRYRITGAWIEDLNGAWHPLRYGIDPRLYTMEPSAGMLPQRYEVRQCIEIFPRPIQVPNDELNPILPGQPAYRLWIKGHFGLRPFWDDAHLTTIEAEAVLLHAIGMAKRHKGMADAGDYFAMADKHVKALVAGSHGTRRYIPGAREDVIWEGPPRAEPP